MFIYFAKFIKFLPILIFPITSPCFMKGSFSTTILCVYSSSLADQEANDLKVTLPDENKNVY